VAQEITNDPVTDLGAWLEGRHVFTSQEDDIATLLNDNVRKTVDLGEHFDGEIGALQSDLSDAESDISTNASDISALQTAVADRLKTSKYNRLLGSLQVCAASAPAASGDTTIAVTATEMDLLEGDELVAFDPANGEVQTITADADVNAGSMSIAVQALDSDLGNGRALLLSRNSLRQAGSAVAAVDDYLATEEGTDLATMAQDVANNQGNISTLSSTVGDLESSVGNVTTVTNNLKGNLQSVEASIETLEGKVQLGVTSRVASDRRIAKVDSTSLDGSSTDEIPVRGIISTLKSDDYLIAYNDTAGEKYTVQVHSIGQPNQNTQKHEWDPASDGTSATIKLKNYHPLNLPDGSNLYLAPTSLRSEVSVVEDEVALRVKKNNMVSELAVQLGAITTKTDIFKSDNFDGAIDRSSDPTAPGTASGDVLTGGDGWALFESGHVVANSVHLRGVLEATGGEFDGPVTMEDGSIITNASTTYALRKSGFDIYASPEASSPERFYGLWDGNSDTFLGGLTANLSGSVPQVIIEAGQGSATDLIAKAQSRAELRSETGNVVLNADGRVGLKSSDIVAQEMWQASGVSDLETKYNDAHGTDPPNNMLWINTSQNYRVETYQSGTTTASVDAGFIVNKYTGSAQSVGVASTSEVTGGTITDYEYDWGDGSTSNPSGGTDTHTYNDGDYTITLTVTTESGDSGTASKEVSIPTDVFDPPDPRLK